MAKRPAMSRGELEAARLLWELGQATVRQVHEALPPGREMDFTTVQTYLRRLAAKGYIRSWLVGRTRMYAPKVKPTTVIGETVGDLVERLFGGQTLPLVRYLIEERGIGEQDIAELRAVLDRLERESDNAQP
ncbi:MAG: BlaI/MecI/CopY family transcriptional regulator [Pirellulales bacterium]|nr:BlaI/MecI/CopY family transcriptional regulator [Pirellulales bacterium]